MSNLRPRRLCGSTPACLLKAAAWLHRPLVVDLLMLAGVAGLIVQEVMP